MSAQHTAEASPAATTEAALAWLAERVGQACGPNGEPIVAHAAATASILAELGADACAQLAACAFGAPASVKTEAIEARFGATVAAIAEGMRELLRLRHLTREAVERDASQLETLRRMLLAMGADLRVVLLRLASRLQTLRWFAAQRRGAPEHVARETLDVLAPLANRLGIWQLKWELEDLSFRFLEPEAYRDLARRLEERRAERERFVAQAAGWLREALAAAPIEAEVTGRPKHLYSIRAKMRAKQLAFEDVQDLRALRVIVRDLHDCYAALDIVHARWPPLPGEYDDYIARPKPNGYQSLHTVVRGDDGRALEIQIRTRAMHEHAEYGVAAHWRYKERSSGSASGPRPDAEAERRIAWARQLLAWERDVGERLGAAAPMPDAVADDRIYALTPQARIVELPAGSTPIDFAYRVHTSLGHRCRGARVDGHLVPLSTPLRSGQTVEVIASRPGGTEGPSRDWLNADLGFVRSARARAKVRQWFSALDLERAATAGRSLVERALQREGRTALAFDELARRIGAASVQQMFVAVARDEIGPRLLEAAIRGAIDDHAAVRAHAPALRPTASRDLSVQGGVLVVGADFLLTQLAKCCRPVPPDPIGGFVTRGRGISVHRLDCPNLAELTRRDAARIIATAWAPAALRGDASRAYPVDVVVRARDRQALLRDVSDVFVRDRLNVTAVQTASRDRVATMQFTVQVPDTRHLARTLAAVRAVPDVIEARRR